MPICESFVKGELSALKLRCGSVAGWCKLLTSSILLAGVPAIGLAQSSAVADFFCPVR
jgi:hypothetical protein